MMFIYNLQLRNGKNFDLVFLYQGIVLPFYSLVLLLFLPVLMSGCWNSFLAKRHFLKKEEHFQCTFCQ